MSMDFRPMGTFRRFETADKVDLGAEEIVKRLEKRKFLPLDGGPKGDGPQAVEETERFGWITLEHLYDTRFLIEKVALDPYLCFALRVDKRKIPQNILRAYLKIEEIAHVNATGKKPGPAKRKELREKVKLDLSRRVLPAAASYQVIWNQNTGMVFLGATSDKVAEMFVQQFEDTFDVTLIPQTPRHLGLRLTHGDAEAIERAAPTAFSKESQTSSRALAGASA